MSRNWLFIAKRFTGLAEKPLLFKGSVKEPELQKWFSREQILPLKNIHEHLINCTTKRHKEQVGVVEWAAVANSVMKRISIVTQIWVAVTSHTAVIEPMVVNFIRNSRCQSASRARVLTRSLKLMGWVTYIQTPLQSNILLHDILSNRVKRSFILWES